MGFVDLILPSFSLFDDRGSMTHKIVPHFGKGFETSTTGEYKVTPPPSLVDW